MFADHRNSVATIQLKDLLDAHFENNENPHVTIARIWALVEGVGNSEPFALCSKDDRRSHRC